MLDSLAYFILIGYTDGIETDYKRVMHAKREIPFSSCPSQIENIAYSTTGTTDITEKDEQERFNDMLERLDDRAWKYESPVKKKPKIESRQHKRRRLGIRDGEWLNVDTEWKFWVGNEQYVINDQAAQYAPIETAYGLFYPMDRILFSDGKFYDMNYDEVQVYKCGGIVPKDQVLNWIVPMY